MAKTKNRTKGLLNQALQLLISDDGSRFDTKFNWKGDTWKFTAYKISKPLDLVRIDLRKIVSKKEKATPKPLLRPMG